MSYLAFGGGGNTPTTGGAVLAVTGISSGMATQLIWVAVMVIILGGTLMTLSRFAPRVAIDAVRMPNEKYRPWLTVNGRPVGKRFNNRNNRRS